MENQPINKITLIKNIYFYLVSFVALMMIVFSAANLINISLKQWVFTKADENYFYNSECGDMMTKTTAVETNGNSSTSTKIDPEACAKAEAKQKEMDRKSRESQRQRDAVQDISFLVIGIPLFAIHWFYARKKDQ